MIKVGSSILPPQARNCKFLLILQHFEVVLPSWLHFITYPKGISSNQSIKNLYNGIES